MSAITLSSSVRQNLLSLQSTAELLSTTQNRLATGKKVNSALDNPTNFFTAQSLDTRAGDINNLLDGIGNGVQILQAANTGITSLQKLVDTAKSIANQALQTPSGFTTKANIDFIGSGAGTAARRPLTSTRRRRAGSKLVAAVIHVQDGRGQGHRHHRRRDLCGAGARCGNGQVARRPEHVLSEASVGDGVADGRHA